VWDFGQNDWGLIEQGYVPPLRRQRFTISSGLDRLPDFPLTQAVPVPYTTQAVVQSLIGGPQTLGEATDDSSAGTFSAPVLNQLISVCQTEVDSYLSPIYRPPYPRRYTVASFQVLTVDSNGAVLTVHPLLKGAQESPERYCGYYLSPPSASPTPTLTMPVRCGYSLIQTGPGSGATLTLTWTVLPVLASGETPSTVNTVAVAAGGSGYSVGDVIGLVGGASLLPAKVKMACTAFVCFALYARRLAPGEINPFKADADMWRGTPTYPGILPQIGQGTADLDTDWPRTFSPGFAVVERDRLNASSL
jgi:hypothetical protein